jgi:tetratricopeptide (TPR) repeat protein
MSRDADDAYEIGHRYFRQGNLKLAEQWWSRAAPDNEDAAFNLAQLYVDTGRLAQASQLLSKLARSGVSEALDRLLGVGNKQVEGNDPNGAAESFATAAELGDADAAFNLGLLHAEAGEIEAAMSAWWLAVRLGSAQAGTNLGAYLLAAGDREAAMEAFTFAAGRGDLDADYNIGLLLLDSGRQTEAARAWAGAAAKGHLRAQEALRRHGWA